MTFPDEYDHIVDAFPIPWGPDDDPAPVLASDEAHSYDALNVWSEPHLCTPDCFSYEDRAADPTIDDHFRNMGAHVCEGCER